MKEYKVRGGEDIHSVAQKVCALSLASQQEVVFTFNDLVVHVRPGDIPADIVELYKVICESRRRDWLKERNYRCTRCGGTGKEPEEE
jgi:hypothetical protein